MPRILHLLKLKDYVTVLGSFFAFVSIILSLIGFSTRDNYWILLSCLFIFFSVCTDTLDGLIARKMKQENDIGVQIDSLSDCVSFVIAPAVMIYSAFGGGWLLIACGILVVCGVLRLAWFNIEDTTEGYIGLVTPMSASTLILYFLIIYFYEKIISTGNVAINSFYLSFQIWENYLKNAITISIVVIILGILNLADFLRYTKKVRKKRGLWQYYIIGATISIISIIIILEISAFFPNLWTIGFVIAHAWSVVAFWCCIGYIIWGVITWYKLKGD
ncbi:MAG: CDP-alcohol phosphatidyltransferase family protein [Candidatus Helarchaeota archaeon]